MEKCWKNLIFFLKKKVSVYYSISLTKVGKCSNVSIVRSSIDITTISYSLNL